MNPSLSLVLYLALGLALTLLRHRQGMAFSDALFCGVFWPLELLRRWIELLVRSLVQFDAAWVKSASSFATKASSSSEVMNTKRLRWSSSGQAGSSAGG